MDIVEKIAEERIKQSIKNGELDNLPNKGKPLNLEDLSRVPPELRASYIMLKNANMLPVELQVKKEIVTLEKLIDCCTDEEEKKSLRKEINEKMLRFDMLMEKRGVRGNALDVYKNKIYEKFE